MSSASPAIAIAPPLPMFSPAGDPDAWHNVTAPGGYEWWYFDAESDDGRTHVVAIFLDGFVFHPGYLRAYACFRRRPTRRRPPVASDYPCAYFVVYRDGRIASQFMTQYSSGDFLAEASTPAVRIGPNRMRRDEAGDYHLDLVGTPWSLTARGPRLAVGETLAARFVFRPTIAPITSQRRFFTRALAGADHFWIPTSPRCDVSGTIQLGNGGTLSFAGRGYHDHNYGTGPIGPGLKRWIWGRALTDTGAISFHFARSVDPTLADELHVLRANATGVTELAANPVVDWSRRTGWLLAYPAAVDFGSALRLRDPRLVDSAPFYMRLAYDAEIDGARGTALCEVAYPDRLRMPVLGRMIEMSIDRRMTKPQ